MKGKWFSVLVLLLCGGLLAWRHGPHFPKPDPDDANGTVWRKLQQPVDLSSKSFTHGDLQASVALDELSRHLGIPITMQPDLEASIKAATIQWPQEKLTALELIEWILVQSASGESPVVKDGQLTIAHRDSQDLSLFVGQVHLLPADLLAITGESSEDFSDVIQNIVTPEQWEDIGGTAEIRALPCALAVAHRYDAQQQIARLLEVIADAHRHPERLDPIPVRLYESRSYDRMEKKLDQIVSYTANENEIGLHDVLDHIRRTYETPIVLDQELVDFQFEVTVDLENVSLRFLLEQILRPHSLVVEPGDGFLIITSEEKFLPWLSKTVVYPVGDFVGAETAADVITRMVSPNDWADVGGDASVVPCGKTVVVSHSREGHAQVADLLRRWRAIRQADDVELDRVAREGHDGNADILEKLVTVHAHDEPLEDWLRGFLEWQGLKLVADRSDAANQFATSNAFIGRIVTCNAEQVPLWHVLETVMAPLRLQIVHGDGQTMMLTTADNDVQYGTVGIYNVEALVGPRADVHLQKMLLRGIKESIAVGSWSDLGGEGEILFVDNVLFVRHSQTTQRAVRSLLDHLIQVPDQPDTFGVLASPFESLVVVDDLQDKPLVTRVYYFPSTLGAEGQKPEMSVARQIREELIRHVMGDVSADVGGYATAERMDIDGREVLVVSHTVAGHNKIQHYLDSRQMLDRVESPPTQPESWQHAELVGGERKPPARLSYRSVDEELMLLERWGVKAEDPKQLDSAYQLYDFLASRGKDGEVMPEDDQQLELLYLRNRRFHVITENEASSEIVTAQVDLLLQTLHQIDQETTLPDDTSGEGRCERLVTIMLEDAEDIRRHVASFVLRCMGHGSTVKLSDAAIECIRRHLADVQDPVICRTIVQLLPVAKERAEPLFGPLLTAMPRYSASLQHEVISVLGSSGPAAVPYLCQLTHGATPNWRMGRELDDLAIQALIVAAGQGDETSIRTILDAHAFAPTEVQKAIAAILPEIDPSTKITRSLVAEFSKRTDGGFQASWVVFREQILLKLGDPE